MEAASYSRPIGTSFVKNSMSFGSVLKFYPAIKSRQIPVRFSVLHEATRFWLDSSSLITSGAPNDLDHRSSTHSVKTPTARCHPYSLPPRRLASLALSTYLAAIDGSRQQELGEAIR